MVSETEDFSRDKKGGIKKWKIAWIDLNHFIVAFQVKFKMEKKKKKKWQNTNKDKSI